MDALECSIFGRTPAEALRRSLSVSDLALTVVIDGRPEAMLGVAAVSLIDQLGSPWMLGTDETKRHPRAFLTAGHALIEQMQALHPRLMNYTHEDNAASIRWLTHLGFDFPGEAVYVDGHRLVKFTKGFDVV